MYAQFREVGMCNRYFQFLLVGLIIFTLAGCCGDGPVTPDSQEADVSAGVSTHAGVSNRHAWGLWEVIIDPDTGEIEAVPFRTADFNANIVRFLQPPVAPVHMLTIALGPGCEPSSGYWVIDVTLAHPFPEAAIFRGFDVRGIIMTEGDAVGIHDPGVRYRGPGGTRLLNADGYTRWWNMQEFTSYGKILGYTEGARSTPGFEATATVNPYKLFTDALDSESLVSSMNPNLRATFGTEPGINTRRYEIQFDIDGGTPPIRFVYAVDASWSLPDEAYAPEYPVEAYDVSANCQEAYLVDVPIFEERPYYESATSFGGDAVFYLTIGDWQSDSGENVIDQISHIWVESPTLIDEPMDVLPEAELVDSTHATQATYRVTVPDCHPTGLVDQYFLITVESAEPDSYMPQIEGDPYAFDWPDAKLAVYLEVDVPVSPVAPYCNFAWAKHAGGVEADNGEAVTTLSDGSIAVVGSCHTPAMFGEDEPNETVLEGNDVNDMFVAKFSSNGILQWVKMAGGSGFTYGQGIVGLSDGSMVVTGSYTHDITFDKDGPLGITFNSLGHRDIFIARYKPDGALSWVRRVMGEEDETSTGITALSDNSVVFTGFFEGAAVFGEDEPTEMELVATGSSCDLFIARYNAAGSFQWAKKAGGSSDDLCYAIGSSADDSMVITGSFGSCTVFGEGEANQTELTGTGWCDIFVARYGQDGLLEWAKRAGGSEGAIGQGVSTLSDGSAVITGYFMDYTTFGPGEPNETVMYSSIRDVFVARYGVDGQLTWAKQTGGPGYSGGNGIQALSDDSMVVTGDFGGLMVFGPGEPCQTELVNYFTDLYDIFIARYNTDGTLAWAKRAGGLGSDWGSGITALSDDSAVITGRFIDMAIFGMGEPGETILESYGSGDIFVALYYP